MLPVHMCSLQMLGSIDIGTHDKQRACGGCKLHDISTKLSL